MARFPDPEQVAELVRRTGQQELLPRFGRVQSHHKDDGSLVSHADLAVQQVLGTGLARQWPQYSLLSEEQTAQARLDALADIDTGVWCLDPLDGTSNFVAGIPYYAISLALLTRDGVVLGVVYDPTRDECFTATQGGGAFLNAVPMNPASRNHALGSAIALVDFKRLPPDLCVRLARKPPYKSQRSFGAVALDWCWLAANRVQLYLHGQQKLWDYAAGQLILSECQGQACTLEGGAVFKPALSPRSAAAALEPQLYEAWTGWLGVDVERHSM